MTPDHATAAADLLLTIWEGEFPATCAVLAAVKDDNRLYKPDAKSRTAWDLATHMAYADMWFLDGIANGKFEWDPEQVKQAEAQFTSVDDIVSFYQKTFPEKVAALRALPGDRLASSISMFGTFEWPAVRYIGFATNAGPKACSG